jgi:hypothetical protein
VVVVVVAVLVVAAVVVLVAVVEAAVVVVYNATALLPYRNREPSCYRILLDIIMTSTAS